MLGFPSPILSRRWSFIQKRSAGTSSWRPRKLFPTIPLSALCAMTFLERARSTLKLPIFPPALIRVSSYCHRPSCYPRRPFRLNPVSIAGSTRFSPRDLRKIEELVIEISNRVGGVSVLGLRLQCHGGKEAGAERKHWTQEMFHIFFHCYNPHSY
jgi:hypothetical protein